MLNFPKIYLASKSPRRKEILENANFEIEIISIDVEENYPSGMPAKEVAEFLANKKSKALLNIPVDGVLLTADSIVVLNDEILEKPRDRQHAIEMLSKLSNTTHIVYTGVCLKTNAKQVSFTDISEVKFDILSQKEIEYYVDQYNPYDKAGGYGIQDWIGLSRVIGIKGSFYNIMGLPIHKVYEHLKEL